MLKKKNKPLVSYSSSKSNLRDMNLFHCCSVTEMSAWWGAAYVLHHPVRYDLAGAFQCCSLEGLLPLVGSGVGAVLLLTRCRILASQISTCLMSIIVTTSPLLKFPLGRPYPSSTSLGTNKPWDTGQRPQWRISIKMSTFGGRKFLHLNLNPPPPLFYALCESTFLKWQR